MAYSAPRVQCVPQTDDAVSFQVEGAERLRWNGSKRLVRPHLFPVLGPSGRSVTRMGHPGDPTHDHHRSVWFGHQKVGDTNLWEDRPKELQGVRQEQWLALADGEDACAGSFRLGWYDRQNVAVLRQDLVIAYRPLPGGESEIELQSDLSTPLDALTLGQTNFGFLGVRVAKTISARFGGGRLTNSAGARGEKEIMGKPADWMDYSGPVTADTPEGWEGITVYDHPGNRHAQAPDQPASWHVRDDGWMCPSFNRLRPTELAKGGLLRLRYLLHVHRGDVQPDSAGRRLAAFAASAAFNPAKAVRDAAAK
jgi:hypothetical protein